jgi:hypothetical protein
MKNKTKAAFECKEVSLIARGAGYPIKEGWLLIICEGREMATVSADWAPHVVRLLNKSIKSFNP